MEAKKYYKNIGKELLTSKQIQDKIKEIALEIEKDFKGDEVVLISNLKGSFRFLSDLVSYLTIPTMIDFIAFASYEGTKSTGHVRIIKDLKTDVKDKNVIIVEDIVDTGITIDFVIKYLNDFKYPKLIKICALLDKPSQRKIKVPIDYKGFDIGNEFIIGYGLDYNEYFRELNNICVYNEE